MHLDSGKQSGQAMVELVVALVVILVLLAGLIQICSMGVSHSHLMTAARREAGKKAMMDVSSFSGPQFIDSCTLGNDGVAFSRDDSVQLGNAALFQADVVNYSNPSMLDIRRKGNPVSAITQSAFPQELFGLVEGEANTKVVLLPIIRNLLYQNYSVELHAKAWMTWTKGIY